MNDKSVRNMKVDTGSGKDVKDTEQLKGEAKVSSAGKGKNTTDQYTCESPPKGDLGGLNKNK